MKFGLAITTFNNFDYLNKLIEDLINHSDLFEKILIVDNNSLNSINSINLIKTKYRNIESYIFPINFGGPAKSRNYAINFFKNLNFDYIAFLDPDDCLSINYLKETKKILLKNKFIDALSVKHFRDKNNKYLKIDNYEKKIISLNKNHFKFHNPLGLSGLILNLHTISTLFSEDKEKITIEDYDFYLRLIKNKQNLFLYHKSLVNFGYYNLRNDHLGSDKFKMLIKFSKVNLEHFGLIQLPLNLILWTIINIKKRIFK